MKQELIGVVGEGHVVDDPEVIAGYGRDESFVLPIKPWYVVRPGTEEEVKQLVAWANKTGTPLVPVSSGPPHFYGDTVPSAPGAVMVDLSRMNKIKKIDRRNRMVWIEPGVTYCATPTGIGQRRDAGHSAALAPGQQVGHRQSAGAPTDPDPPLQLFTPRAVAELRGRLGERRDLLHG